MFIFPVFLLKNSIIFLFFFFRSFPVCRLVFVRDRGYCGVLIGLVSDGGGGVVSEVVLGGGRGDLSRHLLGGELPNCGVVGLGGGGGDFLEGLNCDRRGGVSSEAVGGGGRDVSMQLVRVGFPVWEAVGIWGVGAQLLEEGVIGGGVGGLLLQPTCVVLQLGEEGTLT